MSAPATSPVKEELPVISPGFLTPQQPPFILGEAVFPDNAACVAWIMSRN